MKRIGLCAFAVLFLLTVIASCFSFSVYAALFPNAGDSEYVSYPSIRLRFGNANGTGGTFQPAYQNNLLHMPYLYSAQIDNTSQYPLEYFSYFIILVPYLDPDHYSGTGNQPTIARTSGSISVSSNSCNSPFARIASISVPATSENPYYSWYQAVIVNIAFQSNGTNTNSLISLNNTLIGKYSDNTPVEDWLVYDIGCYDNDNRFFGTYFNNFQQTLDNIETNTYNTSSWLWRLFDDRWSYFSLTKDANDNIVYSENEDVSYWEALLGTLKNLSFDLGKSAQYQNQINAAATNTEESDNDALGAALQAIQDNNAIGIFSSFDVDELAPNDPGELASLIGESITDWFTSENKQNIDNVPRYRIDNDSWITPYSDNLQALLDLIEEGGNEDEFDPAD